MWTTLGKRRVEILGCMQLAVLSLCHCVWIQSHWTTKEKGQPKKTVKFIVVGETDDRFKINSGPQHFDIMSERKGAKVLIVLRSSIRVGGGKAIAAKVLVIIFRAAFIPPTIDTNEESRILKQRFHAGYP